MKRVGRLAVVEESSDVDMACEPPRASVPGQSFPAAFRRNLVTKKDETAAAVAASPLEASPDRVKDEAAADAERMFASMSEQDILKAQEEMLLEPLAASFDIELKKRKQEQCGISQRLWRTTSHQSSQSLSVRSGSKDTTLTITRFSASGGRTDIKTK